MEKLIMLLDIYEEEVVGIHSVGDKITEKDESWICSKNFGFIKWLVDNDKIDLDKLKDNTSFTMLTHSIGLGCEWHTAHEGESILRVIGTNAIIAYLSIQDEPLKFLISVLK